MTLKALPALGTFALIGTLAAAPMLMGPPDYTSLPKDPAAIEATLSASKGQLVKAITAAETAVGGVAKSADIKLDMPSPQVEVLAYADGKASRVMVDLMTGSVGEVQTVPRFPGQPMTGELVTTESGLQYFDIVEGDGPMPDGPSAKVTVHYTGWLVTGEKFDSSIDRGQPITFGLNQVIKGWTEGVGSMKVGGTRKLVIPYDLAYGAGGRPGAIPPKATLIFDVQLLDTP